MFKYLIESIEGLECHYKIISVHKMIGFFMYINFISSSKSRVFNSCLQQIPKSNNHKNATFRVHEIESLLTHNLSNVSGI